MTAVARRSVASEPRARDLPAGVPTVREARLVVESGQSAVFAAEHFDRGRVAVKVAILTAKYAIELAKEFGTADSGKFVNGVLDRIMHGGAEASGAEKAP